ncbi:MAG TPA: POTRA domain-containing protein, partial [Bryobacteraceae bacterium]|nr:POTRA domain-containing protein [Bryobacteraceae bacterium]
KPEFDAACQRLIESGLFEGCNWKYMPVSRTGIALMFEVSEAPAQQKVRLTIPGVPDKDLWEWLRANEPLVQPQIPGTEEATRFYTRAIQRFLKKNVVASVHTDLATRETSLVFRPENVPAIEAVKFIGAQAISPATLEKTLAPIAKGSPFTEYDVQQLLDLNIRPMYENLGRLNVRFPSIKAEGGVVTVQVDEGRVYTLGKADTTGTPAGIQPTLPIGEVARWNEIVARFEATTKTLRNQGYLQARYKIDRQLNPAAGTVNLAAAYTPGRQFKFRELKLGGINAAQDSALRRLWALPAGAPINEGYIDDYLRAAFEKLGPEHSGVAHQLEPAGEDAVDVVITFRRK